MSGRRSSSVEGAVRTFCGGGYTVTAAARKNGCAIQSLRRALRADGVPPVSKGGRPRKQKNP